MAAYCRVSTGQEEQLLSYENQVNYYTKFIKDNPLYTFAGAYADEGISATNTKKREEFNRMIADCREGKIDMIITKSISRFARNTLDCLNYVRELKELGIGILFEKENINTLDAKGEVLLTILSSLAQDESRSISENSTWGRIVCGTCNKVFSRKGWRSSAGYDRKVWQCSERYRVKGVQGCDNRHVEEETLIKAYLMAWNALVENRESFLEQWKQQMQGEDLLAGYRAEKFVEYTKDAKLLKEMDTDFMLKTLDHIKVFEDGTLLVVFLDGSEIECRSEEV